MNSISINYALIWRLSDNHHYQFTKDGKCFNVKRGKQVKKTICGRSVGFCICGKFRSATSLRPLLEKIPFNDLPF